MFKKLGIAVLILSLVTSSYIPAIAQEKKTKVTAVSETVNEKSEYAEIVFDKEAKLTNIQKYFFSAQDVTRKVNVGGKQGIKLIKDANCLYMNLVLDDEVFPKVENGESIAVKVEYFDEGYGHFTLRYSSDKNSSVANICEDHPDVVKLEDTGTWKEHIFYIDDAVFAGTYNGADFAIALWSTRTGDISSEDITLRSVKIERTFPQKPVTVNLTSGEYGNIFDTDSEQKMDFTVKNITDTNIALDLNYSVIDEENNVYETGTFKYDSLPQNEDIAYSIETHMKKYGLYNVLLTGTMKYTFEDIEYVKEIDLKLNFSVVNKFKPDEEKNQYFGVCTHMNHSDDRNPQKTTKIAAEGGIGILRDELRWDAVERKKGEYNFTGRYSYPKEIEKNGSDMLFVAGLGNTNYDSAKENGRLIDTGLPNTKEDMEAFGNYILKAIEESGNVIKYVEIWNEPNYYEVFQGFSRPPEMYAELLKVVYPMIKSKYPDITVIGCSIAANQWFWIEDVLKAGGGDYMDAISAHPYDWSGSFRYDYYHNEIGQLKALMEKYNVQDKEIWYTEIGWATSTVTLEEQAKYMVQLYAFLKANDYADKIIMYEFQNGGTNALEQEHNFGMINYYGNSSNAINTTFQAAGRDVKFEDVSTPWSAKPSYLSLTAMNKIIGAGEYIETLSESENIKAYRFKRTDGKDAIIMWTDGAAENVSLKLGCGTVEIYDWFSNCETVKNDSGVYNVTVLDKPVYIVGNFETARFTENVVETDPVDIQIVKDDYVTLNYTDKNKRDLKVEVEAADIFEIVENDGIKNGRGSIKIYGNPTTDLDDYKINIKMYDGDELCYFEIKKFKFVEPISIGIEKGERENSLDRQVLNIKVENRGNEALSGKVLISEPKEISSYGNKPEFTNLKSGESVILPINIPRKLKKNIEDIVLETELTNGKKFTQSEKISFAEIKYTDKKPTIDGKVDGGEWNGTWVTVDKKENIGSTGFKGWKGAEDCSFSFNMMWDEENLYLCFAAEDNIFTNDNTGSNIWRGDSIQFGLREISSEGKYDANYNEVGIALTPKDSEIYRYTSYSDLPKGSIEKAVCSYSKNKASVIYETAIPWEEALSAGYIPKEGNEIAFSALFNDNDGSGRRGWLEYTPGIGGTKSALNFDRVFLTK